MDSLYCSDLGILHVSQTVLTLQIILNPVSWFHEPSFWLKLEILALVDLWSVQNKQGVGEGQKAM